jgi:sensor c-di-GMP phosphodiesterase-like protein
MASLVSRTLWAAGLFAAGAACGVFASRVVPQHVPHAMERQLRRALSRREFSLVYQPLVHMRSGKCLGVEALARWHQRNGNQVLPELFIPMAIQSGLIEPLSLQVIELAAHDLLPILIERPKFHVGINVPPSLLGRGKLALTAARCGLLPRADQIIIEITETGIVDELGREAVATARALRARVAIDDFGTGENGLAQLQDLEIDFIKIDKQFVRKIGCNAPGCKLVDGIVDLVREIGAQTIAEGVETDAQADYLRGIGVEWGQGWLFARPMPVADLRLYLQQH